MRKKADYKGYVKHLTEAIQNGLPIDTRYLNELCQIYNTPPPVNFDLSGKAIIEHSTYDAWEKDEIEIDEIINGPSYNDI